MQDLVGIRSLVHHALLTMEFVYFWAEESGRVALSVDIFLMSRRYIFRDFLRLVECLTL